MTTIHEQTAPATRRTVTVIEYGIRYTVVCGTVAQPRQLARRVKHKTSGVTRAQAEKDLKRITAWQSANPLCPQVDAVIVTRTVTYSDWTAPAQVGHGDGA